MTYKAVRPSSAASWQSQLFARLRDREWHQVGELFAGIELQIPLHHATRFVVRRSRRPAGIAELPLGSARWRFFLVRTLPAFEVKGLILAESWSG
jgi:hypothetical protein